MVSLLLLLALLLLAMLLLALLFVFVVDVVVVVVWSDEVSIASFVVELSEPGADVFCAGGTEEVEEVEEGVEGVEEGGGKLEGEEKRLKGVSEGMAAFVYVRCCTSRSSNCLLCL